MNNPGTGTERKLTGKLAGQAENLARRSLNEKWVVGKTGPENDPVPLIATRLTAADRRGARKARWTIGRMDYSIFPGLYGVGQPDRQSPVLVTANYKLTLDSLRRELGGINSWLLVLDTKGINVWCAAGKGTFGTKELIRRLRAVNLDQRVDHRTIILPQLGATGVKAAEVAQATGFRVVFGPVRAADIPAFLAAGLTATPAMRQVRFNLRDRLILAPAEFVYTFKPAAILLGILFILNAVGLGHFGLLDLLAVIGAIAAGCILTPVLLPWLPGRAFSGKGALLGLLPAAAAAFARLRSVWPDPALADWFAAAAYVLILPSVTGYLALNFTGSTTFTSPSGVNREMRLALPVMLIATAAGILLRLTAEVLRLFQ